MAESRLPIYRNRAGSADPRLTLADLRGVVRWRQFGELATSGPSEAFRRPASHTAAVPALTLSSRGNVCSTTIVALRRLRRVLESQYSVRLVSDQALLDKVTNHVAKRNQKLQERGKAIPASKPPTIVNEIRTAPPWTIRAIDLLRKLGRITTPSTVNMAQLSASWATRRYFWAIAEGTTRFRLSDDARRIDFHQKGLLSDEFGIGMAALLLEQRFSAPFTVDVSVALGEPELYQNVQQLGKAEPDYLIWGAAPNSPYYVIECKGTGTTFSTSQDQLRRGLEQVPSLVFGGGPREIVTFVVATCMLKRETKVYVVDPPPDDFPERLKDDLPERKISERTGQREWTIRDQDGFRRRTELARQADLLTWAGQFQTARLRQSQLDPSRTIPTLPDLELHDRQTADRSYLGFWTPLFPELGLGRLGVFSGVDEEVLEGVREGRDRDTDGVWQRPTDTPDRSPFESFGRDGTCMIIDGIG